MCSTVVFCSNETKAKIREKITCLWEIKKKMKIAQDDCIKYWKEVVANAARLGGLGEEQLEWGTSEKIKAKWRSERLALVRQEKERLLERQKAEARVRRSLGYSDAHRRAISDAIKVKWADPVCSLTPAAFSTFVIMLSWKVGIYVS